MKGYPDWFYAALMFSLFILFISGCLLIPTTLEMRFEQDVFWRLAFEQRLATVATHTSFSYLIVGMIGALSSIHMRAGLRKKDNHHSGLSLVVLFAVLLISGVGLLYLGDETWILTTSVIHTLIGLSLLLVFSLHYANRKKISHVKM